MTYSQNEREAIKQIDSINSSALKSYNESKIVKAFNGFNTAKKIADSISDNYGIAISNLNLGNIYRLMHENANAKDSYSSMLKAAKAIKDNYLIANAYLNLATLTKDENESQTTIDLFKNALDHISKNQYLANENYNLSQYENLLVKIRIGLAEFYIENDFLEEAQVNLLRAEDIINKETFSNNYQTGYFNYIYGVNFFKKELYNNANEKFNKAIDFLNREHATNDDTSLLLSKIYKSLSLSYSATDSEEQAYLALLKYDEFKDEFLNKEKVKENAIYKSRFLLATYKNEAQLANSEKLYQLKIADKVKKINLIIIIALILLLATLLILYKYYVAKRRLSDVLKQQNAELEIAKNDALKSSELKSKFISNVSHELRTPLYGVVGLTSIMLENSNLDEANVKYLKSLKYSGDYLLNLINDVLQVSKIESKKLEINNTTVHLRSLIQNVTDSFDYSLGESNNQMHIFIDERIPEFILCDKLRLSQVLFNLIGNSIKFTQNGNISIKANFKEIDSEKVLIAFEVVDDGPGISKEKQGSIFDNFIQLNENSNTGYQGAGLGLSIASKIVKLFNSTIELESELGVGSTFSFVVSFKIDTNAIEQIKSEKDEDVLTSYSPESLRILIAEDNKINQIVTGNLLKKENFQYDIVENGLEALKAFKNNTYDLILMDINMPLMDGNEATLKIREFNNQIPIIALTASSKDELMLNKLDKGFDDIITKPFDNDLFFNTINKLIEISKTKGNDDGIRVIKFSS
ncbi:response regulator [Algibacter amylolyticus]|uniref:response regulator n=1 Tax=Algibacter amylolyticus TaxID=1608400 RepID=UPI00155A5BCD|nr:response regulator [Algibacter amylolyticus]MBB5269710.1 signal transduction histidine kinase/CheY-like chemotaxis protein [Algibacter amylolyticus]